jgi:Kef-type K+ transport system membrane component KefB
LFRLVGQPQVMGEMVAGILLGPSLLAKLAPAVSAALFPPSSLSHAAVLSQLGLVLFMFLVGLSLSPHGLQEWKHASVLTSHVSIVLPFVLGSSFAVYLHGSFAGPGVSVPAFALFMGAAMSVTAFPVLARILAERKLLHSRIGTLAIACAAVDDVTGWCLLAYITAALRVSRLAVPLWFTVSGCLAFIAVMICLVRPLLRRFDRKFMGPGGLHESGLFLIVLLMLAAALMTEYLGIHVLFGSFFAGAILPKNALFVNYLREKLESVTLLLFLPLFFAFTGLRTNIGSVHGLGMWAIAVLLLAVAIVGKMGGSTLAGRWAGLTWRDAATAGALLNTRGLMELVILNMGWISG